MSASKKVFYVIDSSSSDEDCENSQRACFSEEDTNRPESPRVYYTSEDEDDSPQSVSNDETTIQYLLN